MRKMILLLIIILAGCNNTEVVDIVELATLEANSNYLPTTLSLVDGVPVQNGIVYPSFDFQEREKISLSGNWKKLRFSANHELTMNERNESWFKVLELEGDYSSTDFDDSNWESKLIPSPENRMSGAIAPSGAEKYENGVWYRRDFFVESSEVLILKALSMNYIADVFINGEWVGYHEGGFTPFAFDISGFVKQGEINKIAIRIDNPPWGTEKQTIPAQVGTDFFNYTGIIQDIYIEEVPELHVARVDIVTPTLSGEVDIKAIFEHGINQSDFDVKIDVFSTDKSKYFLSPSSMSIIDELVFTVSYENIKAGESFSVINESIKIDDPSIWNVSNPNLYVMKITVGGDVLYSQFGIRTVDTTENEILVNNEPIYLKSIGRHEEWPSFGRTATFDRILEDLTQIRELNVNMVRTGHYPNHLYTYSLLDRMGMLSMSEIPLWQFENNHFLIQNEKRLSDQMFREMVFSEYNHPSIIMWSTQNECNGDVQRLTYNERIVDDLRGNYDDNRLITQSAAADRPGSNDISMEPLDVLGWTIYFGVFHGSTAYDGTIDFLDKVLEEGFYKPVFITEFGYWTGQNGESNDMQYDIYSDTMKALLENSSYNGGNVSGSSFWIYNDWYVNHSNWIDTFGVVKMDRSVKPIYEVIKLDNITIGGSK